MSFVERLRRVPPGWWVALFAIALILPRLGSFGFWDPWELKLAERARDIAHSESLFDVTVNRRFAAEPPLDLAGNALGMRIFGVGEFGGRISDGLFGILAILAVYWAGIGLFRRRAAVLGALALGSMPLFVLEARQLTSDMPLVAGLALAMGGLGRYAWPAQGRRRWRDLLAAGVGFVVGLFSGGALLGVALPCLAFAFAILAGWSLRPRPVDDPAASKLTSPGLGPDLPAGTSLGASLRSPGVQGGVVLVVAALVGVLVLVLTMAKANVAGQYSLLLGGVPRGGAPSATFDYVIRQLGFGLFPWSALAIFALGRPLIRLGGGDEADGDRLAFGQLYLLIFAAFGFALSTVFVLMCGEARFCALAPVALAIGALLDEALEGDRAEPVLGLLVATGTMVVARDLVLAPEDLVSVHTLNKVQWPAKLKLGWLFLGAGLLVGAGLYTGLATRGRALGRVALRDLGNARHWHRWVEKAVVEIGRWGIQTAVVVAVLFSLTLSHAIVPKVSGDLSFKPPLESYSRLARHGEPIGRYKVEGEGAKFYSQREMTDLPTQNRVVEFLQRGERVFALVPGSELAALDAALKSARVEYSVVDARSSRFLLLTNRLEQGERDNNPLKQDVWMAPRPPEPAIEPGATEPSRYEWFDPKPPWQWRVPAAVTFGNAVELVGADFPTVVRRPGTIPLSLYFRVNKKPPGGFHIFVHFDIPGEPRVIGDHLPLNGTFATDFWLPGEYIRDSYDVEVPLMTTPAGTYTLLVGFWPGGEGKRLKITSGSNDGSDRARLGTIEIK
ncbi:MAG TPA: glycosyltransferase family 39 protein [Polyangia bacterium]|jgi:4-amino-4-deoxy-L-arabinose transferase and related glycosyltransferases of PMT family|nr:glycosyltransferase family 39 protein [Polyangia bacterium]